MSVAREKLIESAQRFCDAFAKKEDIPTILCHFSQSVPVTVLEHGDPCLAPFLGRSFEGVEGAREYFEIIESFLSYEDIRFSVEAVDTEERKVIMKGQGTFTWVSTNERWDEVFVYVLGFDEEGKVARYELWADSGSAYLARVGQLKEVQENDAK